MSGPRGKTPKIIQTTLAKGLAIVATAILTGLVGGAFVAYRTLNSDHFTLIAVAKEHQEIKESLADHKSESAGETKEITKLAEKVENLEKAVNKMNDKLDTLFVPRR